jgi:hypothetical protein
LFLSGDERSTSKTTNRWNFFNENNKLNQSHFLKEKKKQAKSQPRKGRDRKAEHDLLDFILVFKANNEIELSKEKRNYKILKKAILKKDQLPN